MEKDLKILVDKATDLKYGIERLVSINLAEYGDEGTYNYYLSLVRRAEEFTQKVRELPNSFKDSKSLVEARFDDQLSELLTSDKAPIQFETLTGGVEKVTLGRLLPQRKQDAMVKRYLLETYYPYIRMHYKDIAKPMQEPAVLLFTFYYNPRKEHALRDYDNMETKVIQDMLAPYFIEDDSPKYLHRHNMCLEGRPRTEIYIMPLSVFYQTVAKTFQTYGCIDEGMIRVLHG